MTRAVLLALIDAYKLCLSPFMPPACRFYPTCSEYAREALVSHGVLRGSFLTIKRLLRCHPLCKGGFDPPPPRRGKDEPDTSSSVHSP